VRPAAALGEELVGTAVGELSFAAYARGANADQWLGLTGSISRSVAGKWLAENITADKVTSASDSFMTLAALARLGQGIAILPTLIGDQERDLIVLPDAMPSLTVPIWVAHHVEATETATMKTVQIYLGRFFEQSSLGKSTNFQTKV
jgi:DNA-binding transcriptional LysR family regulator